jgi:MFS transporter, AAHS family, benzoate transport protein
MIGGVTDTISGFLNTGLPRVVRPPEGLSRTQWRLMGALMVIAGSAGFGGVVTTQTITFIVDEFQSSKRAQGFALATIRFDFIISIVLVALADYVGRRRILFIAAFGGPIMTALCALSPSLVVFTGIQLVARAFTTSAAVLIGIFVVEELPAASRAWGSSMVLVAGAVGAAGILVLLPIAGFGLRAWRLLFVVPLIGMLPVAIIWRSIHEGARFIQMKERRRRGFKITGWKQHIQRLGIIAMWVFLIALFVTPARQFLNDYLREERGFSAKQLSIYGIITNFPALLGVPLGGAIADRRGRRAIAGVGLMTYAVATSAVFLMRGPLLWAASILSSLAIALALPAMSVMVTELFPTALRSQVSGFSTGLNRLGGVVGLLAVGNLTDRHTIGATLAALSVAVVIAALVAMVFLPEAARRELEDISGENDAGANGITDAPAVPLSFG